MATLFLYYAENMHGYLSFVIVISRASFKMYVTVEVGMHYFCDKLLWRI